MAREHYCMFSFRRLQYLIFIFSIFSIFSVIFFLSQCHFSGQCHYPYQLLSAEKETTTATNNNNHHHHEPFINLLSYPFAWNHLAFSSELLPPPRLLKIALFVKKWPRRSHAGGLERHALTLHLALARRGHELHIFTTTAASDSSLPKYGLSNLYFHISKPTPGGYLDQALVWQQFQAQNSSTGRPFDVVHTESVGLRYTRSRYVSNLAVSWHGIAYETIHSDIIQELLRSPQEPQAKALTERAMKVVLEFTLFL